MADAVRVCYMLLLEMYWGSISHDMSGTTNVYAKRWLFCIVFLFSFAGAWRDRA